MLKGDVYIQAYPNKSVVEDVLKRTGNSTQESFTPFVGLAQVLQEQFRGSSETKYNIDDIIHYTMTLGMDLNPKAVKKPVKLGGLDLIDKESAGYTYLEDMADDDAAVRKWLEMVIIAYKKNANSPYKTENAYSTYLIADNDGDVQEEKYFLTEHEKIDKDTFYATLDEIPYLLKIISNKSKGMNAHLFSFLRAYAIIRKSKSDDEIAPRDFAPYELWRVTNTGEFDRLFDHTKDNRGPDYRNAIAFIRGQQPNDYAYKACMKLITCIEALEVDIQLEDPHAYSNDYVNRLQCNYLPTNAEYFDTYKEIDQELIDALGPDRLFKIDDVKHLFTAECEADIEEDIIQYIKTELKISKLESEEEKGPIEWTDKSDKVVKYIEILKYVNDKKTNPNAQPAKLKDVEFIDGLMYCRRSIVKFSGEFCGKYIGQYKGYFPTVIFSMYGLAIVLPPEFKGVYYVSIEECIERLTNILKGEYNGGGWHIL